MNCVKWLNKYFYLSYRDFIHPSTYKAINLRVDAMIAELKWPFDPNRWLH